jgi:hypothetical protein
MEIIKDDELIYVNDNKTGINSCGYNVNSLLFNSGISPIMTLNEKCDNKEKNKDNNSTISSLFNNLVVPNWALHYEPHNAKIDSKLDDNSSFEIVDDNLYDKLMDLAIYKDPFFNTNNDSNNMTAGKRKKHNKTKHKLQKNIDVKNQNKNQKKKHKKTRKK